MCPRDDVTKEPPNEPKTFSGRVLVRMPASLHEDLVEAARKERVSLNQFVCALLASGVHWSFPAKGRIDEPGPSESEGYNRVSAEEYSRILGDVLG